MNALINKKHKHSCVIAIDPFLEFCFNYQLQTTQLSLVIESLGSSLHFPHGHFIKVSHIIGLDLNVILLIVMLHKTSCHDNTQMF